MARIPPHRTNLRSLERCLPANSWKMHVSLPRWNAGVYVLNITKEEERASGLKKEGSGQNPAFNALGTSRGV